MGRIEHFALFAADLDALRAFYEDAFGFRVVVDNRHATPPGYFLAGDDGSALELIARPDGSDAVNQRFVCHVAFWVDDYPAARAAIEGRGLRFEADTEIVRDDFRTGFFADSAGNRVQIVWRSKPLGE